MRFYPDVPQRRFATLTYDLLLIVLLVYGTHAWSWLAGPVAALFVWGLDRVAQEPSDPAPAHVAPEPAPVD